MSKTTERIMLEVEKPKIKYKPNDIKNAVKINLDGTITMNDETLEYLREDWKNAGINIGLCRRRDNERALAHTSEQRGYEKGQIDAENGKCRTSLIMQAEQRGAQVKQKEIDKIMEKLEDKMKLAGYGKEPESEYRDGQFSVYDWLKRELKEQGVEI